MTTSNHWKNRDLFSPLRAAIQQPGSATAASRRRHTLLFLGLILLSACSMLLVTQGISLAGQATLLRSISVSSPDGVVVDSAGVIHVATGSAIKKYSASGEYLGKYGDTEVDERKLWFPYGMAIDKNDNIYVSDRFYCNIKKYNAGILLQIIGEYGDENGQFNFPARMALDKSGNLYVVDTGHDRIQKFDSTGKYLLKWGTPGTSAGQFILATAIAVDNNNIVYVSDTGENAGGINRFSTTGTYLGKWTQWLSGKTTWRFGQAEGIAATNGGYLFFVARENYTVHVFRTDFTYRGRLSRNDASDEHLLPYTQDVFVDKSGKIYVAADNGIYIFKWNGLVSNPVTSIFGLLLGFQ